MIREMKTRTHYFPTHRPSLTLRPSTHTMMDITTYLSVIATVVLSYLQPISGIEYTTLQRWRAEQSCGKTLALSETAGQIELTDLKSFSYYKYDQSGACLITVSPRILPGDDYMYNSKVLLYFTEFKLPTRDSSVLNVTLLDGESITDRLVKGTTNAFSGVYDYSFSEPGIEYTTTKRAFTLLIRWSEFLQYESDLKEGGFVLKFATFYDAPCHEETTTCKNQKCVSKQYHCHPDINICRENYTSVCEPKLAEEFWTNFADNIWKSVEKILFWVLIVAGIVLILRVVKRIREQHGGFRPMFKRIFGGGSSQENNHNYTPPNEVSLEMDQSRNFEPARPHVFGGEDEVRNPEPPYPPGGQIGAPPAYDSLPPQPISSTAQLPPPPSYEEFQREEHKYKFEPSEPK